MVSIIENWSDVKGTVLSTRQSIAQKRFYEVEVAVENVIDVQSYANLLKEVTGKVVTVFIHQDLVERLEIAEGIRITCRVRRAAKRTQAGPVERIYAHPDFVFVQHHI